MQQKSTFANLMLKHSSHLTLLALRLGLILIIYSICRFVFWLANHMRLNDIHVFDFVLGIRFDLSAIAWLYFPFILLSLFPLSIVMNNKLLLHSQNILFYLASAISIVFNLIDVEFFPFTFRRSTIDLIHMLQTEASFISLLFKYLIDFWWLTFLGVGLFALLVFANRKIKTYIFNITNVQFSIKQWAFSIVVLPLWVLAMRGGTQLIPISIVDAGNMSNPGAIPLVLNTPFTILKTIDNKGIQVPNYMPMEEAMQRWPFVKDIGIAKWEKPNVVIIIMESFSSEYIGFLNGTESFTPVLDSLMKSGKSYLNAFANGKRSIDGIPAILASLPPLMETPYISSPYASNQLKGIASYLGEMGYTSRFYHGGINGTMGFESFSKITGFQNYIGLNEYPDAKKDYDGNWGIFDEPFFRFFAEELNKESEPFLSVFFSLSSHHPYAIPDSLKGRFPVGTIDIHESIGYADYALGVFFEKASKMPWFNNTLFVITSDHTSYLKSPEFNNSVGMFSIPLCFIMPSDSSFVGVHPEIVQQIDIMPSVLHWLGYPKTHFSFGQRIGYDSTNKAITYISNRTQIISDSLVLQYTDNSHAGLYNYKHDFARKSDLRHIYIKQNETLEEDLKAYTQVFSHRMVNNQLTTP